jgi:hypothetical protein
MFISNSIWDSQNLKRLNRLIGFLTDMTPSDVEGKLMKNGGFAKERMPANEKIGINNCNVSIQMQKNGSPQFVRLDCFDKRSIEPTD